MVIFHAKAYLSRKELEPRLALPVLYSFAIVRIRNFPVSELGPSPEATLSPQLVFRTQLFHKRKTNHAKEDAGIIQLLEQRS